MNGNCTESPFESMSEINEKVLFSFRSFIETCGLIRTCFEKQEDLRRNARMVGLLKKVWHLCSTIAERKQSTSNNESRRISDI